MRLPREITGPIKRKLYPESAIKEAIWLVKEEKYSMRAASFATGCPPSTLHRRFFQGILLAFKKGLKLIVTNCSSLSSEISKTRTTWGPFTLSDCESKIFSMFAVSQCECYFRFRKKTTTYVSIALFHSQSLNVNGLFNLHYRPQRSCGKVMFLHLSVILFTGGI